MSEGTPATTTGWTFHEPPEVRWRHYRYNGEQVTPSGLKICSVTQALSAIDKPALVGWAANVTAQGCWTLWGEKGYRRPRDIEKDGEVTFPGWRRLQKDLKSRGLDHNSVRDEAAFRGTSIHAINEDYVREGKVPNPSDYPEHWRGYVTAMVRYILWCEKRGETAESTEMIVGSVTHGFAGMCDTVAVSVGKDGRRARRDFKTSKGVYARSHFRQLEAYEGAAVEMGETPTDTREVVIIGADGLFYSEASTASYGSFLNVLSVWRDDQPLKVHEDAAYKARVAREKAARLAAKEGK